MVKTMSYEEMEEIREWVSCDDALPHAISWEDDTFFNVCVNVVYDFYDEGEEPAVIVMAAKYDSEENLWFSHVDVGGMDDEGNYELYFHYLHTLIDGAKSATVTHWMPTPKPPCKKESK